MKYLLLALFFIGCESINSIKPMQPRKIPECIQDSGTVYVFTTDASEIIDNRDLVIECIGSDINVVSKNKLNNEW